MSGVLILIAALGSFHSTKYKCNIVSEKLVNLALYESRYDETHIDEDLLEVRKFNQRCQSK